MQCERAQEFFSDYLERTLDRPMTVALESHLAACGKCREDYEGLQALWMSLDAVPRVEPPADGVWQVMTRIQNERAGQIEAERARTPSFLDWLRSLSPMRVAVGAGLATMVVAGTLLVPQVQGVIENRFGPRTRQESPAPVLRSTAPVVTVSYGGISGGLQELRVRAVPSTNIPDLSMQVSGTLARPAAGGPGLVTPAAPAELPVHVPLTAGGPMVETLRVDVRSAGQYHEQHYLVFVPLGDRTARPVTLALSQQPLEDALRRVALFLDRPVVVDAAATGSITLVADGEVPLRTLRAVAAQAGYEVRSEGDLYRLTPARPL